MTKSLSNQIEDAIVTCIEDENMSKEEMLLCVTETYKVSKAFVLNAYQEMYEEE